MNLLAFFRTLLQHWTAVLGTTFAGLLIAVLYLHGATYRYTATLQLVPTEQASPALSRNLSGLASLAGVGLPKAQVSQFSLLLETLRGRDVAAILTHNAPLMHVVFANDWNVTERRWQQHDSVARPFKDDIKALLGVPVEAWHPPGAADLQEFLGRKVGIDEDVKKSVATISFSDPDPRFAAHLLDVLVGAADERLRQRALIRSGEYIAYIQQKLPTITIAEQRDALFTALSEQEKQRMMASATLPFAADPIGSAAPSLHPTFPPPWIVLALGTAAGLFAGILLALITNARRAR